jgi:peptidoglycan/LPS O-acetylase OafA/YrhL
MVAVVLCACALAFARLGSTYLLFWTLGALMVFGLGAPRPRALLGMGIAMTGLGTALYELGVGKPASGAISPDMARALISFGVCLALPCLCRPGVNRALAPLRRAAAFASGFSYSLYLVHYPVVMALDRVIPRSRQIDALAVGLFVGRLAICVLVALAFYLLFERNTARVRRWLGGRWTARAEARPPRWAGDDCGG